MSSRSERLNEIQDCIDENGSGRTGGEIGKKAEERDRTIVRVSVTGIVANVLLSVFKAIVGLLTNSIAIVLDAVNNISDAASSVITIVGTKLAGKEPDRKHPYGYGRIEYMSAMIISVIVLYAGVTSFTESAKKIIHPDTPDYSAASLIIVAVAVVVKIVLGRYVKSAGEKVNSDSLINSGEDAKLDSVISASTLVAAVLYLTLGISVEAWLGAVIAVVIIKSGIEMLRDTISELLGERAEQSLASDVRKTISEFPDVSGVYDLVLNNYGPDTYNGSVHIEVPDTYTADQLDQLIRNIVAAVYLRHHIILTGVGIYAVNTKDPEVIRMRDHIEKIVKANPYVLQMHGFYLRKEEKVIRFDIVISFEAKDRRKTYREVLAAVQKEYPDYKLIVAMDTDFNVT